MTTVYVVPAGTLGTAARSGGVAKFSITKRQLQFSEPPLIVGGNAAWKYRKWLSSVPRSEVIVSHHDGQQSWNVFGI